MGFLDKFRKSVKAEKKKIVLEEFEKEYGRKYNCKDPDSKEKINQIRKNPDLVRKAADKVLKRYVRNTAIAGAAVAALTGAAISSVGSKNEVVPEPTTTQVEQETTLGDKLGTLVEDEVVCPIEPVEEDPFEVIAKEIDNIETSDEMLNYFKNLYIEEYNKENDTNISASEIEFYSSSQDYVYDIEGAYVTHSAYPEAIRNKIQRENCDYDTVDDVKVYSVYQKKSNEKKEMLESFAMDENYGFANVILGDDYINGKELDSNVSQTILKTGSILMSGIDETIKMGNSVDEKEKNAHKQNIKGYLKKYYEENNSKENKKDVIESEFER